MKIDREITIDSPIEQVWQKVSDMDSLLNDMPGVERVEPRGKDHWFIVSKYRVMLSELTFDIDFRLTQSRPPTYLETQTEAKEQRGAGGISQRQTVSLQALSPNRTRARYESEISLNGLIGIAANTILHGKVEDIANHFSQAFIKGLERQGSPA